ncbi:MAG: ribosomal L7Ae/L30e/S12e/Gadd45 family protein [Nanoarchaeota archaeon]|nr:ribosomal L7Ae/L30e/S12e/Gadd45 family protein [Nanoarchaeota archaeon]
MAKKVVISKAIEEIKEALKNGKAVIGSERSIKLLRTGEISKIFVTSNCPENMKNDINHYADLAKVEVVHLKQPNDELGIICKKPFAISLISVLK